jgi:hypothetical protein
MMASVNAHRIIDQWATIVDNGAGRGEQIYTLLDEELKKVNIPNVRTFRVGVKAGMPSNERDFFIIRHTGLREYSMYVHAHDIGGYLNCGWFLTVNPGFFKRRFSKRLTGNPFYLSQKLGIFSQQDLSAWTHIVHRIFKNLVTDLMHDMDMDITGMNTTSKGFLSVW